MNFTPCKSNQCEIAIVGSRCGGYDFYTEHENQLLWLGPRENSDIDVFCNVLPSCMKYKIDRINSFDWFFGRLENGLNIWGGVARPYKINEKLYLPDDLIFLCIAIRKKISKIKRSFGQFENDYKIYDKNKNFVTTINFRVIF